MNELTPSHKSSKNNRRVDQAILFADVSGSSALYKQKGNEKAKQLIDAAINLMSAVTTEQGGTVVKTIGDEVMARFRSPEDACRAAGKMQERCQIELGAEGLALRIGVDYGHTLVDGNDVFGETVNDAACVTAIARANQIVVTESLVAAVSQEIRERCEEFDRISLKGEEDKSLIYRLVWESSQETHITTVMSINHITQHIDVKHLILEFNQQVFVVTPDDVPFIIGRDHRKAQLHIDSSLASRDHCHIVMRRGKFVLLDHSTNGTYVQSPDQPELYLRREEIPLIGEGSISIGRRAEQAQGLTINYRG